MINLEYLKYFVALVELQHFGRAARHCKISQPALTQAVQRLESILEQSLVIRTSQPIQITQHGMKLYDHAQQVLRAHQELWEAFMGEDVPQHIRLGIIPTLSTYLVPLFLGSFIDEHPTVSLEIVDLTTDQILDGLRRDQIDVGVLVTPLADQHIDFTPLFYEELFLYAKEPPQKEFLVTEDIDLRKLWLLEEGHCLRNQVLNLCQLQELTHPSIQYHAGNIETLINLVERYDGMTIVPELALLDPNQARRKKVSNFVEPSPAREVSLAALKQGWKSQEVQLLAQAIHSSLPSYIRSRQKENYIVPVES